MAAIFSCHQIFISLYLKACIQNRVQIGTVVSEKIRFEILCVHDLGPRSSNDLDLQYSLTFINSIRCLLLPTFRSLAATVSEKSTFYAPNFEKVGSILVSACPSVLACVCVCVHSSVQNKIQARVSKFHIWILRQKKAYPYFFLSESSPLAELCPF